MPDVSVVVNVDRTALSLPPLELETPGFSRVVDTGPGQPTWRKTWTESPHAHGAYLTAAVKDIVTMPLKIRLEGDSPSDIGWHLDQVVQAFSQFQFELYVQLGDDAGRRWKCFVSEVYPEGGLYNPVFFRANRLDVLIEIPRHPVPLLGGI